MGIAIHTIDDQYVDADVDLEDRSAEGGGYCWTLRGHLSGKIYAFNAIRRTGGEVERKGGSKREVGNT